MMKTKKFLRTFIACAMSLVIVWQVTVPVFASASATVVATAVPYTFDIIGEAYAIVAASEAVYAAESIIKSQALASTFYATDTAASAVLSSGTAVDVALTSGGNVASVSSGAAGAPVFVTVLGVVAFAAVLSWCAGLFFEGLNEAGIDLGSVSSEKLADILVGYLGSEQTTYEQWIATPEILDDGTFSNPNDEALVTLVRGKFVVSEHYLAKARSFVDWITNNISDDRTITIAGNTYYLSGTAYTGSGNGMMTPVTYNLNYGNGTILDVLKDVYGYTGFETTSLFNTLTSSSFDLEDYFLDFPGTSIYPIKSMATGGGMQALSTTTAIGTLSPIDGDASGTFANASAFFAAVNRVFTAVTSTSYPDVTSSLIAHSVPAFIFSTGDVTVYDDYLNFYPHDSNDLVVPIKSDGYMNFYQNDLNSFEVVPVVLSGGPGAVFYFTINGVRYDKTSLSGSNTRSFQLFSEAKVMPFMNYSDSLGRAHIIFCGRLSSTGLRFYDYILPRTFGASPGIVITNVPIPKLSIQVNPSTQAVGNIPIQYEDNVNTSVDTTPDITLDQFDTILDESFTDTNYEADNPVISTDDPIPPITGGPSSPGSPDDDSAHVLPSFTWNIGQWIYSLIRHYMPADIAEIVILGIEVLMFVLIVRLGLKFFS